MNTDPDKTMKGRLLSEGGELLRVRHLRGETPAPCGSCRGPSKGKALEQARLIYAKPCQFCGKEFQGIAKAGYCSNACRQKAKRKRAKGHNNHPAAPFHTPPTGVQL